MHLFSNTINLTGKGCLKLSRKEEGKIFYFGKPSWGLGKQQKLLFMFWLPSGRF